MEGTGSLLTPAAQQRGSPRGAAGFRPSSRLGKAFPARITVTQSRSGLPWCSVAKNLSPTREAWARPLGRADPLRRGMAAHSSALAWETPWTEEPGGLQPPGSQRAGHDCAADSLPARCLTPRAGERGAPRGGPGRAEPAPQAAASARLGRARGGAGSDTLGLCSTTKEEQASSEGVK